VFWTYSGVPASVEVDDSGSYRRKTDLTLDHNRFVAPLGTTGYSYGQARGTDVYLTSFSAGSVLRQRESVGETMIVGSDGTTRWLGASQERTWRAARAM
jgi:hypothetical protein